MSLVVKSLLCFSIGGVALVTGGALAPAAAATGAAAGSAAALGPGMQAIGGSLLANVTEQVLDKSYLNVQRRLRLHAEGGLLPQNHDFFRAVRRSQLHAMLYLVESYAREARKHSGDYHDPEAFRRAADAYLKQQLKLANRNDLGLGPYALQDKDTSDELNGLFKSRKSTKDHIEPLWTAGRDAAWAELETAIDEKIWPGEPFLDWFTGRYGIGYVAAVQQFFAEKLKTDGRLQAIVFMEQLTEINAGVTSVLQRLSSLDNALAERFQRMEALLLKSGSPLGSSEGLEDRLLTEIASLPSLDEIANTIRNLMPHDDDLAKQTAEVVAQRISSLLYERTDAIRPVPMPRFFGREKELSALDDWVDNAERGARVLCAPSGGGKSGLLAAWIRRRTERGDDVARHFISLDLPDTYKPTLTVRHLLDQLRKFDRIAGVQREAAITGDEDQLKQTLYGQLCIDRSPEDPRLIVVVDGLDELNEPFASSFLGENLGRGIYVVVSRRAAMGDTPTDIRTWLQVPAGDDVKQRRIDLRPMSVDDVLIWLEDVVADADEPTMRALAHKLAGVTDGLPLFLRYVIDIELLKLSSIPFRKRVDRIMSLTAPFSGFLKDYIEGRIGELEDHATFTPEQRALFATLSLIKGPISENDLSAVYKDLAPQLGLAGRDVRNIDPRLRRWLSIQHPSDASVDASKRIAFDHPRLAREFAIALRELDEGLFLKAEEVLWSWGMEAWMPSFDKLRSIDRRGAVYATQHAPQHGLDFYQMEDVARILMDQDFIRERFLSLDPADAAFLMARDWMDWDRMRRSLKS